MIFSPAHTSAFQLPLATLQNLLAFSGNETGKERREEPRFVFSSPVRLRRRDASRRIVRAYSPGDLAIGIGLLTETPLVAATCIA